MRPADRARAAIEQAAGSPIREARPLSGGSIAEVLAVETEDGRALVAKLGGGAGSGLALEGAMLRHLEDRDVPVPSVLHADDHLLLMTRVPSGDSLGGRVEDHAAHVVAALHDHTGPAFGFEYDTVIGGLHQPNPQTARWVDFFRDHRLLFMAGEAESAGRLPARLRGRIETLAGRLEAFIDEPARPSLLHGDLWGGNVLADGGRVSALIDPALYWGHPEIELAFTTLFGTFGEAFFARYRELRPLAPGFFEQRRDLYNLYPLLVHVRLFGGSYVGGVDRTLRGLGV
jgi:fructosamine-3-kinase